MTTSGERGVCSCGRTMSTVARTCWACHTRLGTHPLRTDRHSLRAIAREAGVSERTVRRAAAGAPMSRSAARRVSEVTGIDIRILVLGRWLT